MVDQPVCLVCNEPAEFFIISTPQFPRADWGWYCAKHVPCTHQWVPYRLEKVTLPDTIVQVSPLTKRQSPPYLQTKTVKCILCGEEREL